MDAVARAARGFAAMEVAESTRRAALDHLEAWLVGVAFSAWRPQVLSLVDRGAWDLLLDSFWRVLPFGTGGRRGPVGVGPNRFNPWTLATSIAGHATWLGQHFPGRQASVVIAYDVRVFRDLAGRYDPDVPSPVLGWSSRDFAELAARVYAAHGVRTWLQPRGDTRFLATPELSFAVRHLGASAGLVVSASHNPPDDNGAKLYDHLGGQAVPPDDEAMARAVEGVDRVEALPWEEARPWVAPLGPDVREVYLERVAECSRVPSRSALVWFTGLHGVGAQTTGEALLRAGYPAILDPTQCAPDGAFPTVPGGIANPELPRVLERAQRAADASGYELVLATDPDADRVGCAVRRGGRWRALSGDEIALLVVDHVLSHWEGPGVPLVVQTEVTSQLVARMARARGAEVVDHLPVGFKYIGAELRRREEAGEDLARFAVGVEESHGILASAAFRDKDAAGGALLLAEAASLARDRGRTLVDVLEALWGRWGCSATRLVSIALAGATGRARIERIQAGLRSDPPRELGGRRVLAALDRQVPSGPLGPLVSETDAASRDMVVLTLEGDARVAVRPSGTEPRTKAYVEVLGPDPKEVGPEADALAAAVRLLLEQ